MSQHYQTVANVASVHQLVRFGTYSSLNLVYCLKQTCKRVQSVMPGKVSYALYSHRNSGTRKHQDSANLHQCFLCMVMSADIPYPDFLYWRDRKIRNIVQLKK